VRLLALLPLLLALLAGCGAPARQAKNSAAPAPPDVARASAFYPELAHYDRAIAALRAAEALWTEDERAATVAHDRVALQNAFTRASARLHAIARESPLEGSLDTAALRALASDGGGSTAAAYGNFRDDLLANERSAIAQARRDATQRIGAAYAQRRQQLYEDESSLALALTRRDAIRLMLLRVRANDLHVYAGARRAARAQLAALEARERAALAARSAHDARVLAEYRATLVKQTDLGEARTIAQIERRTAATLAIRRDEPAARAPSDVRDALASLRSSQHASLAQTAGTARAFGDARAAIGARFASLASADARAKRALDDEISELERERQALYDDILAYARRT